MIPVAAAAAAGMDREATVAAVLAQSQALARKRASERQFLTQKRAPERKKDEDIPSTRSDISDHEQDSNPYPTTQIEDELMRCAEDRHDMAIPRSGRAFSAGELGSAPVTSPKLAGSKSMSAAIAAVAPKNPTSLDRGVDEEKNPDESHDKNSNRSRRASSRTRRSSSRRSSSSSSSSRRGSRQKRSSSRNSIPTEVQIPAVPKTAESKTTSATNVSPAHLLWKAAGKKALNSPAASGAIEPAATSTDGTEQKLRFDLEAKDIFGQVANNAREFNETYKKNLEERVAAAKKRRIRKDRCSCFILLALVMGLIVLASA